jgi:hypothetical protein
MGKKWQSRTGEAEPQAETRREFMQYAGVGILAGSAGLLAALNPAKAETTAQELLEPEQLAEIEAISIGEAMWTHGAAVEVQTPPNLASLLRVGFWSEAKGLAGSGNWFHFAIPTPVITRDRRAQLLRVGLRYDAFSGAVVQSVHVWDGDTNRVRYDNLGPNGSL